MNLCVFQGTFNPIHNAHLKMADYVLNNFEADKIIFIPAYKPPHKNYNPELSYHRLNMVKLAVQDSPKFEVSDIEYNNEQLSYTYNTVCRLYKIFKIEGRIKFIIGTDAFEKIETWYEIDKLKQMVDFLVFVRENENCSDKFLHLKEKGFVYEFAEMNFCDISSTEIRKMIKYNEKTDGLLPAKVKEYIDENGLYRD